MKMPVIQKCHHIPSPSNYVLKISLVGNNLVTRRLNSRTSFNLPPLGLYGISGKQAGNEFSLFSKSENVREADNYTIPMNERTSTELTERHSKQDRIG